MIKDYYEILEIAPNASHEKIRVQYRLMLQAWHPDKFPKPDQKTIAEQKTKEINEAYYKLSDPVRRAEYDRKRSSQSSSRPTEEEVRAARNEADEERKKREASEKATRQAQQETDAERKKAEEERRKSYQYKEAKQREEQEAKSAQRKADEERQTSKDSKTLFKKDFYKLIGALIVVTFILSVVIGIFIQNKPTSENLSTTPIIILLSTPQSPSKTREAPTSTTRSNLQEPSNTNIATSIPISEISNDSNIIFFDDFEDRTYTSLQWAPEGGAWEIIDGAYICTAGGKSIAGDIGWEDYTFSIDIKGVEIVDKIIVFRFNDKSKMYGVNLRSNPFNDIVLVKVPPLSGEVLQSARIMNYNDVWYSIKVSVVGNVIKIFVNNKLVINYTDNSSPILNGRIGVGAMVQDKPNSSVYFDNATVEIFSP